MGGRGNRLVFLGGPAQRHVVPRLLLDTRNQFASGTVQFFTVNYIPALQEGKFSLMRDFLNLVSMQSRIKQRRGFVF